VPRQTTSSNMPELVSVMENSFSNERRSQQAGKHAERVFGDLGEIAPAPAHASFTPRSYHFVIAAWRVKEAQSIP
jgi:hypothetical protein